MPACPGVGKRDKYRERHDSGAPCIHDKLSDKPPNVISGCCPATEMPWLSGVFASLLMSCSPAVCCLLASSFPTLRPCLVRCAHYSYAKQPTRQSHVASLGNNDLFVVKPPTSLQALSAILLSALPCCGRLHLCLARQAIFTRDACNHCWLQRPVRVYGLNRM